MSHRRLRGDVMEDYKIFNRIDDGDLELLIELSQTILGSNVLKIKQRRSNIYLQKGSFSRRVPKFRILSLIRCGLQKPQDFQESLGSAPAQMSWSWSHTPKSPIVRMDCCWGGSTGKKTRKASNYKLWYQISIILLTKSLKHKNRLKYWT